MLDENDVLEEVAAGESPPDPTPAPESEGPSPAPESPSYVTEAALNQRLDERLGKFGGEFQENLFRAIQEQVLPQMRQPPAAPPAPPKEEDEPDPAMMQVMDPFLRKYLPKVLQDMAPQVFPNMERVNAFFKDQDGYVEGNRVAASRALHEAADKMKLDAEAREDFLYFADSKYERDPNFKRRVDVGDPTAIGELVTRFEKNFLQAARVEGQRTALSQAAKKPQPKHMPSGPAKVPQARQETDYATLRRGGLSEDAALRKTHQTAYDAFKNNLPDKY